MNGTTAILLRNIRFAIARHGRDVTLTSLRAGATGRGNYIAAEGRRDNDLASYALRVLLAPSDEVGIGNGTGDAETMVVSCMLSDLPLVEQQRKVPCKGWIITGRFDDATEQEEQFSIVDADRAADGQVRKLTLVRKK